MRCPHCDFEQSESLEECPKCGIVFKKYQKHRNLQPESAIINYPAQEKIKLTKAEFIKELFFHIKPEDNPIYVYARAGILIILIVWGIKFIITPMEENYAGHCFLHNVNLPFHEAGHIIFSPFGKFVKVLGGSLGQLLIPFICLSAFLIKTRDTFGASVALWWFGENFVDLAPYVNDARDLKLILLGGVTGRETIDYHDWEYLLRKLGWLKLDHTFAHLAHYFGIILMITAVIWGGYILIHQHKQLKTH